MGGVPSCDRAYELIHGIIGIYLPRRFRLLFGDLEHPCADTKLSMVIYLFTFSIVATRSLRVSGCRDAGSSESALWMVCVTSNEFLSINFPCVPFFCEQARPTSQRQDNNIAPISDPCHEELENVSSLCNELLTSGRSKQLDKSFFHRGWCESDIRGSCLRRRQVATPLVRLR